MTISIYIITNKINNKKYIDFNEQFQLKNILI